jgi:hypothetical protein
MLQVGAAEEEELNFSEELGSLFIADDLLSSLIILKVFAFCPVERLVHSRFFLQSKV